MVKILLNTSNNLKKKEKMFLIIQSLLAFMLIIIGVYRYLSSKESSNNFKAYYGNTSVYHVYNNFDTSSSRGFFSRNDFIDILEKFYNWENKEFKYLVQGYQCLEVKDRVFPIKFDQGYEYGRTFGATKSLQVNDYFFKYFHIKADKGRLFKEKDYYLTSNSAPIILGSEYNEYIGLNDKLNINYLGLDLECEVVGFLPRETSYHSYGNSNLIKSLDRYMVLPAFEYIADSVEFGPEGRLKFERMFYQSVKTTGHIKFLGEYSDGIRKHLLNLVEQKCNELEISPVYGILKNEGEGKEVSLWATEGDRLVALLLMLVIVIVATLIVCISVNMTTKILSLKRLYAILIANGTKKLDVYMAIIKEILILNLFPMLFAFVIFMLKNYRWLLDFILLFKIILILSIIYVFVSLIAAIYPCLVFKKLNIAKTLQGDN